MSEKEDLATVISWKIESFVLEDPEPNDLIYETSGDIFTVDDGDEREYAGKFRIYYVDVERASNEGVAVFDVLDAHSSTTAEYYDPIFDSDAGDFNDKFTTVRFSFQKNGLIYYNYYIY